MFTGATTRYIEIDYIWQVGAERHAALTALLHRLASDLGAALAPGSDVVASLRPFLAVRIHGVISLKTPSEEHDRPVRALLTTPDGDLLTIRRIRPGQDPYWVLPGGGVENGEDLETALARELRDEIAATADVHSLLHILDQGGDRQYFYLARFLLGHLHAGTDLFTLPDLRASQAART